MSPKVIKTVIAVLGVVNAALLACVQQNVLPAQWSHGAALLSYVIVSAMHAMPAAAPSDAPSAPPAA